jgi:hypothetical protein
LANDVRRVLVDVPPKPSTPSSYVQLYNSRVRGDYLPIKHDEDFCHMATDYRDYWIGQCPLPDIDLDACKIEREYKRRQARYERYQRALRPLRCTFLSDHQFNVPWCLSFLVPNPQVLARYITAETGILTTHWYPPLHLFFKGFRQSAKLANSCRLGREVCNLWLDHNVSEAQVVGLERALGKWQSGTFRIQWSMKKRVSRVGRKLMTRSYKLVNKARRKWL